MCTIFNTIYLPILIICLIIFLPCSGKACSCQELQTAKIAYDRANGIAFSHTPAYHHEISKALKSAKKACKKHIGEPHVAIVSDLDETLFDNREELSRTQVFNWSQFGDWMKQAKAPLIKPTAKFLDWARKNDFAVFFVTGRKEEYRKATIENLVLRKVCYDGLFMRANSDDRPAQEVKTPHREAIESLGFKIIVNLGDQLSDLAGGHAEDCEKLPNYMYFVQ